ncbi:A kinase (PRKA) anchor protein 7 [Trypanosoma conorhini]|uniref:A kinase (PRKA) anchor protein 7 n=1 Tax=Trypanosoma conorhini TaxID=83891 RepID=A0A3R7MUR8_9TRYP|nr:A kinase (PRKA) anchor protein 7 [Trypanosoma conorhini]RNF11591.1 A kinase (PRKA) anchor protein 7 [Trypanosoma conorhini]
MLRRTFAVAQKGERGLYFPINHRIVDRRVASGVTVEEADVQSRYRRELRTSFTTGETRQTIPPLWSARERPTHFLSLRLPARNALRTRVNEMHNQILFSHHQHAPLLVPLAKLHITLGVMTISESEERERLASIYECVSEVFSVIRPLQLRFRGLGTFGFGRVLFVRVVPEADFGLLDAAVFKVRRRVGGELKLDMKGNPHDSYVPHVTIAKIRSNQRAQFGDRIPLSLWAGYQHHDFGDVTFSQVDICRMRGSADGYYHTEGSVQLS